MTGDSSGEAAQSGDATRCSRSADVDECVTPSGDGSLDVASVVAHIHDRGAAVRERELREALSRLEAQGDLSPAEREAVAALADRLVNRLLAVPVAQLRSGAAGDDEEAVETALSLFGRG